MMAPVLRAVRLARRQDALEDIRGPKQLVLVSTSDQHPRSQQVLRHWPSQVPGHITCEDILDAADGKGMPCFPLVSEVHYGPLAQFTNVRLRGPVQRRGQPSRRRGVVAAAAPPSVGA